MDITETQLSKDESYEEIAATYQCLLIAQLNESLIENGVKDRATRKAICQAFAFQKGVFDDQFWFTAEGAKWYPLLGFSQVGPNPISDLNKLGKVQLRSDAFEFHEYAYGNVDWFFDEQNEDVSEIETGN